MPGRDALRAIAVEAGDYLLWTQVRAGTGVIPFPAFRGGSNRAFQSADHFFRRAEREGRLGEVVRDGWAIDDLADGGLQFDNGLAGLALFELGEVTGEARFRDGAVAASDWAIGRACVPNWNYNAFSVELLATAYRVTGEAKYLDAARRKARLGVVPGQLREGPHAGRWADPHNARPAYHYIMVRALLILADVLPADDPERTPLLEAIRRAMTARNAEFAARGVMNVDSTLEALLRYEACSADLRRALGPCHAADAMAVLERYCVSRLRAGDPPFSPGVAGACFARTIRAAAAAGR